MDKMKFNYQVVFNACDDLRIIFAGQTSKSISEVIKLCRDHLVSPLTVGDVENVIYQPINSQENGSQESTR